MKENSGAQVALFSETFGKAFADMAGSLDVYRRENAVLREMLRERGLPDAKIRREVKKRMRRYQIYEEAIELSRKVCERTLDLLRANDPLERILENSAKMGKGDAN